MASNITIGFNNIIIFLEQYGVVEIILPFLLIFTMVFAVLQRIKLFGDNKKNIHVILALILSLITVIPHFTGRYPANYDPVNIINALIPSAGVIAVVVILLLFLFGIFGSKLSESGAPVWAVLFILIVLGYIFGTTVGWWAPPSSAFSWWDSDLSMTIVALLILGAVIFFITGDEKETFGGSIFKKLFERVK